MGTIRILTYFEASIKMHSVTFPPAICVTPNLAFFFHRQTFNHYFLISSCTTGSSAAITTARHPRHARSISDEWRRSRNVWIQWTFISQLLHITVAESRTISDIALRANVHADQQHYGHRQYLRTGSSSAVLGRRMGPQYSLLPRSTSHRSSSFTTLSVVRVVCTKCITVFNATACGATARRRRSPRVTNGRRSCCGIYGSH